MATNGYPLQYSCLENYTDLKEPSGLQCIRLQRDGLSNLFFFFLGRQYPYSTEEGSVELLASTSSPLVKVD